MAVEFFLEEMRRTGDGSVVVGDVYFKWTVEKRSAPRESLDYEISQRTIREDYPGGQEPTEQVLGHRYEPFTIHGVWQDKYNFSGFADQQRGDVEELIKRGNICRMTIDNLRFYGIITKLKISYRYASRIGWEITLSPFGTMPPGWAAIAYYPKAFDIGNNAAAMEALITAAENKHRLNQNSVQQFTIGSIYLAVAEWLNTIRERMNTLTNLVEGRILSVTDPGLVRGELEKVAGVGLEMRSSVQRIQSACEQMKAESWNVITTLSSETTDDTLAYLTAMNELDYEDWARYQATTARNLFLLAAQSADELAKLNRPDIIAVYKPHRGENLYSISQKFYGTPHRWQEIMDRNDLFSFVLSGSEVLIIPRGD